MSSGQRKVKHPFNKTQIKNGRIVRLRKDGTVKADLGPWPKEPKDQNKIGKAL